MASIAIESGEFGRLCTAFTRVFKLRAAETGAQEIPVPTRVTTLTADF